MQTTMVGPRELSLECQVGVFVKGQVSGDQLFQLLFEFYQANRGKLEILLTKLYDGDSEAASARVDEQELWVTIMKGAINEDRDHVRFIVRKITKMHKDMLTMFLNDGRISCLLELMLKYTDHDPLLTILIMYYDVLSIYRRERMFAQMMNVPQDESVLAARTNCARKILLLFPQTRCQGIASVAMAHIPRMEKANSDLHFDDLFEALMRYVNVVLQRALLYNKVKLPETARTELPDAISTLLRKSIRKCRPWVFHNVAGVLGLSVQEFSKQLVKSVNAVVNRLFSITCHHPGATFDLFVKITDEPPPNSVDPNYEDSTETSEYDTDDKNRNKPTERRRSPTGPRKNPPPSWQLPKGSTAKQKPSSKQKPNEDEDQTLEAARAEHARLKQELAEMKTELEQKQGELDRKQKNVEFAEAQLFESNLELDNQRQVLDQQRKEMEESKKKMKIERKHLQAEKEEEVKKLQQAQSNVTKSSKDMQDRHKQHIVERLNRIAAEQIALEAERNNMREESMVLQRMAERLAQQEQALITQKNNFEAYRVGEQLDLQLKLEVVNNKEKTMMAELCDKFFKMTTSVTTQLVQNEQVASSAARAKTPKTVSCSQGCRCARHGGPGGPSTSSGTRGDRHFEEEIPDSIPVLDNNLVELQETSDESGDE